MPIGVAAVHVAIRTSPHHGEPDPDQRDQPRAERRGPASPNERADGGRPRQGAEGQPLFVRAAVQDAVDEDGPADDRRRERIAGQQRDERRGAERHPSGRAAHRGTGRPSAGRPRWPGRSRPPRPREHDGHVAGSSPSRDVVAPRRVRPIRPAASAMPNSVAPGRSTRPAGAACPSRGGRPAEDDGDDPDRDVDVEDPAPGRREDRRGRAGHPGRSEGSRGGRAPGSPPRRTGPAAMPRKVRAPMTPSARGRAGRRTGGPRPPSRPGRARRLRRPGPDARR